MKDIEICILCLTICIVYYFITSDLFSKSGSDILLSRIDGERYWVQADLPDKQLAVDTLAKLHLLTISLLYYMKKNHPDHPLTIRLLERYDPNKTQETHPHNNDNSTSFTINKSSFSFCLRNKQTLQIHNINDLSFVLLHELSHQAVDVTGHPRDFWIAFKTILQFAIAANVYRPVNYELHPFIYCGLPVEYNPLYDKNLHT